MTQEEKQLLLKDLCARLPYGVISNRPSGDAQITEIRFDEEYNSFVCYSSNGFGGDISFEKPYLRPMSSMTKKEKKEYDKLRMSFYKNAKDASLVLIDWLNAHHFDYRGLIEKGLALEAPEDMYKYENGGEE